MRHLVGRVGLRTLLSALLALGCLLGVAVGVGLAWPVATAPFALNATISTATPHHAPRQEHLATARIHTTGCGKLPPAPPGVSTPQTLRVGALERRYRLRIPAAYQADTPTPLVLSFHGHGGDALVDERFTGLSELADLHGFIAVYPQGEVGPDGMTGWNTSREKDPPVDDLLFVDTLLTHLQGDLCVDPQRIYAMGFSNGGGMTAVLACVFADRIAAFAPVAGDYYPQPDGCHPARAAPIVEIHGTADTVNPYDGSARLRYPSVDTWLSDWAERDRCGQDPSMRAIDPIVTEEAWSACQDSAVVLHYRLKGVGHMWPSHAALAGLAVHSGAFDATSTVWAFFERFALPASDSSVVT